MTLLFKFSYGNPGINQVDSTSGMLLFAIPWLFLLLYSLFIYLQHNEIHLSKLFLYFRPLDAKFKDILWERFIYYQELDEKDKKRFEIRVNHFIVNKKYVAEDGLTLTDEIKTLIAAACVQMGFGLAPIYLAHFSKVIVKAQGPSHAKEIRKNRAIIISWKEFEEGYAAANDGYNPGLQSLAIALSLEQQLWGGYHGILGNSPFKRWRQKSRQAAGQLIQTGMTRFKSIRQVDENEYFASAVVYFFEQPQVFHQKFPELYKAMKYLLKQDPRIGKTGIRM